MAHEASDQQLFLLAALPLSKWQIGLALGIVFALLAVFGTTALFANTQRCRSTTCAPVHRETFFDLSDALSIQVPSLPWGTGRPIATNDAAASDHPVTLNEF